MLADELLKGMQIFTNEVSGNNELLNLGIMFNIYTSFDKNK